MSKELAPAYQWYIRDWRSSRATMRMSMAERGVYREMLDEQWEARTLPDSPEDVADLIATTDTQRADVLAAWTVVRRKFVVVEGGRIQNARLERQRKEKRKFEKWGKDNAAAGGRARVAQAGRSDVGTFTSGLQPSIQPGIQPSPAGPPPAESGWSHPASASASASASATASSSASASATAPAEPSARSKRPIFTGQRVIVFEWMLDDLMRMLGAHTDNFDLHEWFFTADAKAMRETAVVADWWPWLKAETQAEAQRRGLPVAIATTAAPPLGKLSQRMAVMVANSRSGS